jgi:hypothetical protein
MFYTYPFGSGGGVTGSVFGARQMEENSNAEVEVCIDNLIFEICKRSREGFLMFHNTLAEITPYPSPFPGFSVTVFSKGTIYVRVSGMAPFWVNPFTFTQSEGIGEDTPIEESISDDLDNNNSSIGNESLGGSSQDNSSMPIDDGVPNDELHESQTEIFEEHYPTLPTNATVPSQFIDDSGRPPVDQPAWGNETLSSFEDEASNHNSNQTNAEPDRGPYDREEMVNFDDIYLHFLTALIVILLIFCIFWVVEKGNPE